MKDTTVPKSSAIHQRDSRFNNISGYKLSMSKFLRTTSIIYVTLAASLGIAFVMYFSIWSMTSGSTAPQEDQEISPATLMDPLKDSHFWFGFILLTLPILLYSFTFITYIYMLFDARLNELVKILAKDPPLRERFSELYKKKANSVEDYHPSLSPFGKFHKSDKIDLPAETYLESSASKMDKDDDQARIRIMTEIVEKLSFRLDGVSVSGYFFALVLLQIVVGITFSLPALEFARTGGIGTNIIITPTASLTANYLSFWAIEWGIFGAFIYSFINLMERIPRKDVTPRYYLNVTLRYIFAIALSSLFFLIFNQARVIAQSPEPFTLGVIAAISFTIGMFPNKYFRAIASFADKRIGHSITRDIPLEKLTGLSPSEATRLWEEGIDNVDQMADASVQELFVRTRFDPNRLKTLVGRALLWKYVFGLDRMRSILPKLDDSDTMASNEDVKYINQFPFTDIQSICTFLFSKPLANVTDKEVEDLQDPMKEPFKNLMNRGDSGLLTREKTLQIISMTPYFRDRLNFVETDVGARETLNEEFGISDQKTSSPR